MNICLDTETTGLNPSFDEILQLSIIDSNTNEVLFNDYFKPQYTVCWDEAQAVNGISYDDVSNCKSITQSLAQIQNIIDRADKIYNYSTSDEATEIFLTTDETMFMKKNLDILGFSYLLSVSSDSDKRIIENIISKIKGEKPNGKRC